MITLEATYRIVTPLFIGDAEQKATDLRPPSIKGALRFWWRALNWKTFLQQANGEPAAALRQLHEQEGKLFGLAALEGKKQGQGCFILQVTQQPKLNPKETTWPENNTGSGYLGYGLMASGQGDNYQAHREGFTEKNKNSQFSLSLIFKPKTPPAFVESLQETLKIWGLLGGLGSRARRGFGSVSLLSLKRDNQSLESFNEALPEYSNKINNLLKNYRDVNDFPPYSAFSQHSRFEIITAAEREARDAHSQAGNAFKNHRGEPSELRGKQKIPFGLPLQNVDKKNRRSSPLLFHVHPLKGGNFVASVLYLPAEFHPQYPHPQPDLKSFYRHVSDFMDVFKETKA